MDSKYGAVWPGHADRHTAPGRELRGAQSDGLQSDVLQSDGLQSDGLPLF